MTTEQKCWECGRQMLPEECGDELPEERVCDECADEEATSTITLQITLHLGVSRAAGRRLAGKTVEEIEQMTDPRTGYNELNCLWEMIEQELEYRESLLRGLKILSVAHDDNA